MICIPISRPTYVYDDNVSVIHNTSKPKLTLNKKCHEIAIHAIWNSLAIRKFLTFYIRSEDNLADLFVDKKEIIGKNRKYHIAQVLCDIYDENT